MPKMAAQNILSTKKQVEYHINSIFSLIMVPNSSEVPRYLVCFVGNCTIPAPDRPKELKTSRTKADNYMQRDVSCKIGVHTLRKPTVNPYITSAYPKIILLSTSPSSQFMVVVVLIERSVLSVPWSDVGRRSLSATDP